MSTQRDDIILQADVIDELDWEPSVNAADIGVTVHAGVVTLTGYLPNYAQKRAAEEAALRVAGVKAVAENIEVRLPNATRRTDAEIAQAALDTIKWHAFLPEDRLTLRVQKGVVTIEGEVEWQYEKDKALESIRNMTGVVGVIDLIKLTPKLTPSGVKEKIRKALERVADEDASHIEVSVTGSEIVLRGEVKTWVDREQAVRAAWAAPGVTMVRNEIKVIPHVFA